MRQFAIVWFSLAMALGATGGASTEPAQQIDIALTDYAFAPNTLALKQGISYRLHFRNRAGKSHSFSAPEFFAASQVAAEDGSRVEQGAVELAGGQEVDILVTPGRAGTYPFTCTHFMHSMMGMHGSIVVQ